METANTTRRVNEDTQVDAEKSIRKAINDVRNLFHDKEDERFLLAMDNLHLAFEQVGNYVDEYEHQPPTNGFNPELVEKEIRKHAKGRTDKLYVELGFRTFNELHNFITQTSVLTLSYNDFNANAIADGYSEYRVYGCEVHLKRIKRLRDYFGMRSIDMVENAIQLDINALQRQ